MVGDGEKGYLGKEGCSGWEYLFPVYIVLLQADSGLREAEKALGLLVAFARSLAQGFVIR